MSDTHKNVDLMNHAADLMIDTFGVEIIYHLGDDYEDSGVLAARGVQVTRVPGIYDKEYSDPAIPKRMMEEVQGVKILAAHAAKTIPQNEIDAVDIILVGHTHIYEITSMGNAVVFNPGHLKGASDKGRKPTFGIIQIDDDRIRVTVHDLNGKRMEMQELNR